MRLDRLTIIILFLAACKPTQVTTTSVYREDLSVHRLEFAEANIGESEDENDPVIDNSATFYSKSEITNELDSVNQLIILSNQKKKLWDGYVIQVYRGNSRADAYRARDNVEEFFSDLEAEVSYRQPTYRVKVGQYFDRLEATRKYQEVLAIYPRALLLPEKLPLPTQDGDN
jgi:hypothetical protein